MEGRNSVCPVCNSRKLMMKYEASYVYSYEIDSDAPGTLNINEFLPYLYDNREQKGTRQYIECSQCGTQIPFFFHEQNYGLDAKSIERLLKQKADRIDSQQ